MSIIVTLCFFITQVDVENIANIIWDILEPLLFASIGTEIDLFVIKPSLIISAITLVIVTLMVSDQKSFMFTNMCDYAHMHILIMHLTIT